MTRSEITWLIGGPQGSGVETAANIFARVCAQVGYQVFGKREFYSNIKGEHSYFVIRVSNEKVRSNVNDVDVMVAYDAETLFRHASEMIHNGVIIYDSNLESTSIDEVLTLDLPFKERLREQMSGLENISIKQVLDAVQKKGVRLYPVSFREILATLAEKTNNPKLRGMIRMFNVIGVSLSLGMLNIQPEFLLESIERIFAKKALIADINKQAAKYSYDFSKSKFEGNQIQFSPLKKPNTILVQGHQGTAIGKIACGCRFQSYYPITPASDESVYLESNEILEVKEDRPGSTVVVQTEDEISAIGMLIGAALTGVRSSTSTSGPGFSLMAEALGWAGINEVPIVITLFQRSGPSTGLPTRHGQDDLLFAIHAGHGEFPRIVYASGDIEESFYDTANCFNYSDVFSNPCNPHDG